MAWPAGMPPAPRGHVVKENVFQGSGRLARDKNKSFKRGTIRGTIRNSLTIAWEIGVSWGRQRLSGGNAAKRRDEKRTYFYVPVGRASSLPSLFSHAPLAPRARAPLQPRAKTTVSGKLVEEYADPDIVRWLDYEIIGFLGAIIMISTRYSSCTLYSTRLGPASPRRAGIDSHRVGLSRPHSEKK